MMTRAGFLKMCGALVAGLGLAREVEAKAPALSLTERLRREAIRFKTRWGIEPSEFFCSRATAAALSGEGSYDKTAPTFTVFGVRWSGPCVPGGQVELPYGVFEVDARWRGKVRYTYDPIPISDGLRRRLGR